MLKMALKNTVARKGRLLLTALAVIAGCAFLSGVFVFSDTITGSFNRLFSNAFNKTDAFVRSEKVIEGDFGQEIRARIPDSILADVEAIPGVADVFPYVEGFARISNAEGKEIGIDGPPKFGGVYNESAVSPMSPWDLDSGRAVAADNEVAIDKRSAKEGDIELGEQVTITSATGARQFSVVGIVTFSGSDSAGGVTQAMFTLKTVQEFVTGEVGQIDAVIVGGDGSLDEAALSERIASELGQPDVEVLTGAQITKENQDIIAQGFGFFTNFLTVFAGIALLVGSFVIYNVFRITAAQRQRENALLRAIGAQSSQVVRAQMIEAAIIGLVGGLLGFLAGLGLATSIIALLKATGFGPSDTKLAVEPSSLVWTVVIGLVVTLVCAVAPAIRAGRVPPLAAMRDVSVDRSGVSRRRVLIGIALAVLAVVSVAAGFAGAAVWLGLGVAAMFASLIALGPVIVAPLTSLLRKPLRKLRGVTGEIAVRNAARSPERTSLTALALAIGLALLVGVSTLGSSLQGSIRETVGELFTGDFAISSSDTQGFGGLPTALADELNTLPEVGDAVGLGGALVTLVEGGEPKQRNVLALDPVHAEGLLTMEWVTGGWSDLGPTSLLVSKDKAERDGLVVGQTLEMRFLNGSSETLTIGAIYDSDTFGNLIVNRTLVADRGFDAFDLQILASAAPGVDPATALEAIETVTERYPSGKLQTRDQFIDDQVKQVNGFLNFIYALLLMSVFIAVLGIVLTLLLAVYERRRELGLSRAIGMTRSQVRSSIRWEAIATAILGAVMGTALGLALGWIIVTAFKDEGLNVFSVSVPSIIAFAVLAVVFAVLAAWLPARRAARSDILDAIATT